MCGERISRQLKTSDLHNVAIRLNCGHVFGSGCLRAYLQPWQHNDCPQCHQVLFQLLATPTALIERFLAPKNKLKLDITALSEYIQQKPILNPYARNVNDAVFPWDEEIHRYRPDIIVNRELRSHLMEWLRHCDWLSFETLGVNREGVASAVDRLMMRSTQLRSYTHRRVVWDLNSHVRIVHKLPPITDAICTKDELDLKMCLWIFLVKSPYQGGFDGPGAADKQMDKAGRKLVEHDGRLIYEGITAVVETEELGVHNSEVKARKKGGASKSVGRNKRYIEPDTDTEDEVISIASTEGADDMFEADDEAMSDASTEARESMLDTDDEFVSDASTEVRDSVMDQDEESMSNASTEARDSMLDQDDEVMSNVSGEATTPVSPRLTVERPKIPLELLTWTQHRGE